MALEEELGPFRLPEPSMILGSPMHKKAEFRLLNQVIDSGSEESGNEFASSFANSLKSSQSTIEKIKAAKEAEKAKANKKSK